MRKTVALLVLCLCFAGCAGPQVVQQWDFPVRNEIAANGLSRERIFDLSKLWFERNLRSQEWIIAYANREEGVIVANGDMDYPASSREEIARIQYTISFRVGADISEGRIDLVFTDIRINVPKYYDRRAEYWLGREYFGGYSRPPVSMDEHQAAQRGFSGIVGGLRSWLAGQQ